MEQRRIWFFLGLFSATLSTLVLEVLNTRLLSVITWYHLSFFAVSAAMFGMAAGAVHVYLGGDRFQGTAAREALSRYATWFAISIPVSHIANLSIPIRGEISTNTVASLALTTIALGVPFFLSGILVAICLTRIPGKIGTIYAVDLLGAALGSLLILKLLDWGNITSAALACAAIAAVSAVCFRVYAGGARAYREAALALVLLAAAVLNNQPGIGIRVAFPKGNPTELAEVSSEHWSIHGQVVVGHPSRGKPQFWGAANAPEGLRVESIKMRIDGSADTLMTRWDGNPDSVDWVQYDVTALPYHIRKGGDAAVIGVGGGRDLLTAVWARSSSITGVEINRAFVELLKGPKRDFTKLADRPEVRIIHDEARSYLTRTDDRFDVLQMSLIDTWAATGAGAFTLSENGLYTLESWDVFLRTLKPDGVFSVSRWYAKDRVSETSKLVSLATAAVLRLGVNDPSRHLIMVAASNVATLLVSPTPFSEGDLATIEAAALKYDFQVVLRPQREPADPLLAAIVSSPSIDEIRSRVAHPIYDFMPATDARPYFFNILKPLAVFREGVDLRSPGVGTGNLLATLTLTVLALLSVVAVLVIIVGPLWRSGLPQMERSDFTHAVAYFSLIGFGFMLIQIGFMQRFSVYLGHPVYAVAIILFSMILATGAGSALSDRISIEVATWATRILPFGIAAIVLGVTLLLQPLTDATIQNGLFVRCLVVCAIVAPTSMLLGMCFPIGMRLVGRISSNAAPWLWGVNGACGVLATVVAVALSMWYGIQTSFYCAAIVYGTLAIPAGVLWRRGSADSKVPSASVGVRRVPQPAA